MQTSITTMNGPLITPRSPEGLIYFMQLIVSAVALMQPCTYVFSTQEPSRVCWFAKKVCCYSGREHSSGEIYGQEFSRDLDFTIINRVYLGGVHVKMYRIIEQIVCSFILSPSTSFPLLLHTLVVSNEPILIHYHYLQSTVCIKAHTSCCVFLWVFKNAHLLTWLYQVFVAVRRIFSCGVQTLSCNVWDLVP